jgi:N-formylglutamate amidohydrolase
MAGETSDKVVVPFGESHDTRPVEPELSPPCGVDEPDEIRSALVFSSPHSGNVYPARFLTTARLDAMTLRRSEDAYVEDLFAGAATVGAPLLKARFPRAYLDVNREPWELDPAMFSDVLPTFVNARSPRVRMGLGTIARVVASGEEIYARKLCFAEAKQRVDALYYPYHQALRGLVEDTEEVFGGCLLIDCHSMPSAACLSGGAEAADFVLGDCHGTSCTPEIIEAAREFLTERHFTVALNAPYSGGFTTGHYGCPERRRHALQIEINRALYMDERSYRRKPGFSRLAVELAELIDRLSQIMQDCLARR